MLNLISKRSIIPIMMIGNDRSWTRVGCWLKIIQEKNIVSRGDKLSIESALVTLTLYIPSTHKIIEKPNITIPFISNQVNELEETWKPDNPYIKYDNMNKKMEVISVRKNNIVSLDAIALAFCWYEFPSGGKKVAIRINTSPI